MIRARVFLFVAALSGASLHAAMMAPTPAEIRAAIHAGADHADVSAGYPLADHVIHHVADARNLDPADGAVDAVLLATPWERVRHAAFLAAITGTAQDPASLRRAADLPDGWLEAIVYAHGNDEADRAFPARFGPATLTFGTQACTAGEVRHSEPEDATYPLHVGDRERFVATIAYRFDCRALPHGARAGTLAFTDAEGMRRQIPFDLAMLR